MSRLKATARHPRGWDRVVAQLNAAEDRKAFLRGMLDVQCKVVAAEYGAIWFAGPAKGEVSLADAWPEQLLVANPAENPVLRLLGDAAKSGFEKGISHILKIEPEGAGASPDGSELGAHVFVTPLRTGNNVVAVSTVVAECRDAQVLQMTAPLRELAAGLYEGFEARQQALLFRSDAQRVRKAMALLAVCQEASGFTGSCLNLVNELARQLKCLRVSMGWVKGKGVRLIAMSDTEDLKRHSEQVGALELAMAECLDQQQPIMIPVGDNAEPLLAQAVVHAHRRIMAGHTGHCVLTIPLRHGDEWLGALTLERLDEPFDSDLVQQLQMVADVVSPHLHDRRKSDRWLVGHIWNSVETAASYLVGPKHVAWKLGALLLSSIIIYSLFGHWQYKVSADFVLEAQSRRILPAPYQGNLREVMVQPGDFVKADTVLARLDATELKLQLAEATAQMRAAQLQQAQGMAEGKISDAQQAQANVKRFQAQIDLLEYQITHATIKAPIDGYVLTGYWKDKIGGVVQLGDAMFEVAPLEDLTAVLRVSETDIDTLQQYFAQEKKLPIGKLATRAHPEQRFVFDVVKMVPLAGPVEGANVFEVRCRLQEPAPWLRPGMEGLARVEVGPRRLFWIATHRATDAVRLWLWW